MVRLLTQLYFQCHVMKKHEPVPALVLVYVVCTIVETSERIE